MPGWRAPVQARRNEYDDVGGAFSYQAAGRSPLSESVALRASWSESERPPFIGVLRYTPFVRRVRACLSLDSEYRELDSADVACRAARIEDARRARASFHARPAAAMIGWRPESHRQ